MTEKNTDIIEVFKYINTCDSWSNLENKLLDSGMLKKKAENIDDRIRFIDSISKIYYHNYQHVEEISSGLPGSVFYFENNKIIIHGMIHDTPILKLSPILKKEVRESLQNKEALYEDGYEKWCEGESFEERKGLKIKKDSVVSALVKYLKQSKTEIIKQREESEKYLAIKSINDYRNIRKELFRMYLPGPLSLSLQTYKKYGKDVDSCEFEILPKHTQRIIYEATKIKEYLYNKRTKTKCLENQLTHLESRDLELHVLVGAAHENPLKYLLNNQKILDKFKIYKKINI